MAECSPYGTTSLPEFAKRRSVYYKQLKKVQEELLCAVCLDFLEEPKLLQCAHSFCRKCLVDLVVVPERVQDNDDDALEGRVQCPSCREYTSILGGKVDALKTNFKLRNVVDIFSEEDRANQLKALHHRMNPRSVQNWQLPVCSQHVMPQEYYCSECKELLCRRCMMAAHRTHDYHEAEVVLRNRVAALRSLIQPAWEAAARAEDLEREINTQRDFLTANSGEVKGEVKAFFAQARRLLDQREHEVLKIVEAHASSRLDKLTVWEARLTDDRSRIVDSVAEIDTLVECTGDVSVIPKTHTIVEALNTHQRSILRISEALSHHGRSSTRSLLTFDPRQSLDGPIKKLGSLKQQVIHDDKSLREVGLSETDSSEDERESRVGASGGRPSPIRSAEEPTSLTPQANSPEPTHESPVPPATKACQSSPTESDEESTGLTLCALAESPESMHESQELSTEQVSLPYPCDPSTRPGARPLVISYSSPNLTHESDHNPGNLSRTQKTLPLRRGKHLKRRRQANTLDRKTSDPALPAIQTQTRPLSITSKVQFPGNVTGPPTPVSSVTSRISVLPNSIEECFSYVLPPILVYPQSPGGFATEFQPVGVTIGQSNAIIACDIHKNVVKVIAASGRLLDTIGSEGREKGQFRRPSAVAVDSEGTIFIADNGNSRIQKFSSGTFSSRFWQKTKSSEMGDLWGIAVSADGKIVYASDWQSHCIHAFDQHGKHINCLGTDFLQLPVGIAINTFGNLLVADREHHCVWVLSARGQVLKQIGNRGKGAGQLSKPHGIAVHPDGFVLVSESGNSRVSIFSQIGEFIACFGDHGTAPGQFNHPKHICVNARGHVVVADELNHRVQVFDISPLVSDIESKLLQ